MRELEGLVAAVTGGAGGIGAATVELLSRLGAQAIVVDRVAPSGGQDHALCDLSSEAEIISAIEKIRADHGRLDILVNNAGIGAQGDVSANSRDDWHRVLDINVVAVARMSAAALPLLRRSPHAAIVNVSSVAAMVGIRNRALYSASKGAVVALTLAMAADHVKEGIRVNCVTPGTADTPWIARLLSEARDPVAEAAALRARQPTGRLVAPDEVARAVAYLASPASASTTGTVLAVDGGMGTLRVS